MHKVCLEYLPIDRTAASKDFIELDMAIMNENEAKDIAQSVKHDDVSEIQNKLSRIIHKVKILLKKIREKRSLTFKGQN